MVKIEPCGPDGGYVWGGSHGGAPETRDDTPRERVRPGGDPVLATVAATLAEAVATYDASLPADATPGTGAWWARRVLRAGVDGALAATRIVADAPTAARFGGALHRQVADVVTDHVRRELLRDALAQTRWGFTAAARLLGGGARFTASEIIREVKLILEREYEEAKQSGLVQRGGRRPSGRGEVAAE